VAIVLRLGKLVLQKSRADKCKKKKPSFSDELMSLCVDVVEVW
jgi:hypothetical protein